MKRLLLLFMVLAFGCTSLFEHTYMPFPDITFKIKIEKIQYMKKLNVNFVFFDLEINNTAEMAYNVDLGNIKAEINGYVTVETNYASIASADTKIEKLDRGISKHKLYFVLNNHDKIKNVKSLKIINFGISPAPFETLH